MKHVIVRDTDGKTIFDNNEVIKLTFNETGFIEIVYKSVYSKDGKTTIYFNAAFVKSLRYKELA